MVEIRHRAEKYSIAGPVDEVVALARQRVHRHVTGSRGPGEYVDCMAAVPVCQCSNPTLTHVIDTAADQRIAIRGKISDTRRVAQFLVEPWRNVTRVWRSDIDELRRHLRAQMTGHNFFRQAAR